MRRPACRAFATPLALALGVCCAWVAVGPVRAAELPLRNDPFIPPAATRPPPPPMPATVPVAATPEPVWQPKLRATVVAGSRSLVSLDGKVVALGEEVDGHRLVRVDEQRATFAKNGVQIELKMDGGSAVTR
jgi:hypothetical protein